MQAWWEADLEGRKQRSLPSTCMQITVDNKIMKSRW